MAACKLTMADGEEKIVPGRWRDEWQPEWMKPAARVSAAGRPPPDIDEVHRRVLNGDDLAKKDNRLLAAAISVGDLDLVKYLVHCGVSPNAMLGNGLSAVQHSASQDDPSICRWLLSKGGEAGSTAIAQARQAGHGGLAKEMEVLSTCSSAALTRRVNLQRTKFWILLALALAGVMYVNTLSNLLAAPSLWWSRPAALLWSLYFVAAILVYFRACAMDPGVVEHSVEIPPEAAREWTRICPQCKGPRPPRSRHCHICGVCVRRFDHHCAWTDRCVGQRSHGTFFIWCSMQTSLMFGTAMLNLALHRWASVVLPGMICLYSLNYNIQQWKGVSRGITLNERVNSMGLGYEYVPEIEEASQRQHRGACLIAWAFLKNSGNVDGVSGADEREQGVRSDDSSPLNP